MKRYYWGKDEIRTLLELIKSGGSFEEASVVTGRSAGACQYKYRSITGQKKKVRPDVFQALLSKRIRLAKAAKARLIAEVKAMEIDLAWKIHLGTEMDS